MKAWLLWCCLVLLALPLQAETALDYLNYLRSQVGLKAFQANPALAQAAMAHAQYLAQNQPPGHLESPSKPGFSGQTPEDRAVGAGYLTRRVSENLSLGQNYATSSIDSLMGAIYHRFGFLDFGKDELGFAQVSGKDGPIYVYVMGSKGLNDFCAQAPSVHQGDFYPQACKHQDKVSARDFDHTEASLQAQNPKVLLWPPPDSDFVSAAFYEEDPDPLPDLAVSGYPLSVQFNPALVKEVLLQEFTLTQKGKSQPEATRLLDQASDPHHKFSPLEFALFPLERLEWGKDYQAKVRFVVDGQPWEKSWTFRIKDLGLPQLRIKAQGEEIPLLPGVGYALYLPPSSKAPTIENLRWSAPEGMTAQVEWIDRNNIKVFLQGQLCQEARFELQGGLGFVLRISSNDGFQGQPAKGYAQDCVEPLTKHLPRFVVQAQGEVLHLKQEQDYHLDIPALQGQEAPRLRYEYPQGLQLKIKQVGRQHFIVRLAGHQGDEVKFSLPQGGEFRLKISY